MFGVSMAIMLPCLLFLLPCVHAMTITAYQLLDSQLLGGLASHVPLPASLRRDLIILAPVLVAAYTAGKMATAAPTQLATQQSLHCI